MNDDEVRMRLRAVGMECFVRDYYVFADDALDNSGKHDALERAACARGVSFTKNAMRAKASKASSIIRAGAAQRALRIILQSRSKFVTEDIKNKAQTLLNSLIETE